MVRIVSTGKTLASEKFLEKRRRARRKRSFLFVTIVIILVGVIISLLRHEILRIAEIRVVGNEVVSSVSVVASVEDSLSGYYFWLIPRDSVFFYPRREMRVMLKQKFIRFSIVEISFADLHTLEVAVVERKPLALYCTDSVNGIEDPDSRRDGCYFLDETGFIFDVAPTFSDGVYFVYSHEIPLESPLGKEFVTRDEFWELDGLLRNLSILELEPSSLKISERNIDITFGDNSRLFLKRNANLALVLSNLETFLNAPEIRADTDFIHKISELDLRTDNKIFYTLK